MSDSDSKKSGSDDEPEVYVVNGRTLSNEEVSEYKEMFNLVDKDGGGSISKEELADLMNLLNIKKTPEELEADMAEIDADGSGDVDFDEFVAVMAKSVNTSYTSDQVKAAFKVFEVPTHPGYIKADQVIKALMTYGTERSTLEEAKELISQLEADPNGMINYEDYISTMMN